MQKNKKYLLTMLTFVFVIACTFFFQKDVKAAEKTGTVTFSIERFTIGQGYLIEPCQVDIYDTDNIASVVDRVLTQEGYGYENKGKIEDSFYLEQIYYADTGRLKIPSIISNGQLKPIKNANNQIIAIPTNTKNDGNPYGDEKGHYALGEFAYCNMSGWMYTVNNVFPTGMSLVKPKDGDIIRLQFTLYGYGRDLGEKPADEEDNNYLKLPDRDAITKRLAVMLKYKASCDEHGYKQAYQKAYNAVIDWNTTEKKMKEVFSALPSEKEILQWGAEYNAKIAESVTKTINAIGTVDLSKESQIAEARKSYNALTSEQKELISADTLKALTDAEKKIVSLKAEKKTQDDAKKKAEEAKKKAAEEAAKKKAQQEAAQKAQQEALKKKYTPSKTSIKSIKKLKKNQAKLTWKKVKNATGYEVYQSMKKNSGYKKVKKITKNKTVTYKAGKLKKKKTYYFKIRTYRKAGGTTYYGNYSNVKKMKVK